MTHAAQVGAPDAWWPSWVHSPSRAVERSAADHATPRGALARPGLTNRIPPMPAPELPGGVPKPGHSAFSLEAPVEVP